MDLPELGNLNLPEKEEKILKAAVAIFFEKGYSAATTSEIAKKAGVAEGTIFRYFKTKKDILRGILIQLLNILSGNMVMEGVEKILNESDGKDLRTIIKELFYDRLKLLESIFPMARIVLTEAMHHEDVREAIYENIIKRASKAFEAFYGKMLSKGLLRSDVSPDGVLRCFLGNLAVLIAQRQLYADKMPIEDFDKELDMVVDIILRGIAPPSPSTSQTSNVNR